MPIDFNPPRVLIRYEGPLPLDIQPTKVKITTMKTAGTWAPEVRGELSVNITNQAPIPVILRITGYRAWLKKTEAWWLQFWTYEKADTINLPPLGKVEYVTKFAKIRYKEAYSVVAGALAKGKGEVMIHLFVGEKDTPISKEYRTRKYVPVTK